MKKWLKATMLAFMAGGVHADNVNWAVPLTYEAVPAHMTMTVSGKDWYGHADFSEPVAGPASAGKSAYMADSEGWQISMRAANGYTTPVFWVCPFRNGVAVKSEGVVHSNGTAAVAYDYGDAVHVYGIETTKIPVKPEPGPGPEPEPEDPTAEIAFESGYSGAPEYTNITVKVGAAYGALPEPVRTGYVFGGWFIKDTTTRVLATTFVREEGLQILKADWTPTTYWVAFDANGGSGAVAPVRQTYGAASLQLPKDEFARPGFVLDYWTCTVKGGTRTFLPGKTTVETLSDVGGTVTMVAQWKAAAAEEHALSFTPGAWGFDGEAPSGSVTSGSAWCEIPEPTNAVPERPFLGWQIRQDGFLFPVDLAAPVPDGLPAGPVELEPLWGQTEFEAALESTGIVYTVERDGAGCTNGVADLTIAPNLGVDGRKCVTGTIAANKVDGETYQELRLIGHVKGPGRLSFKWKILSEYIGDNFGKPSTESLWERTTEKFCCLTNGVLVRAIASGKETYDKDDWQGASWIVSSDYDGEKIETGKGEMVWREEVIDVIADQNEPTEVRWLMQKLNYPGKDTISSGVIYLDQVTWNGAVVTNLVSYEANGGTGTMAAREAVGSAPVELDAAAFVHAGKTFAGWATREGGEAVFADGAEVSVYSNATVWATWKPNAYKVRYAANGGVGTMPDQAMTCGEKAYLMPGAFTRDGYDFAGWAKAATGGVAYADRAEVADLVSADGAQVTLYAVWRKHVIAAGEVQSVTLDVNGTRTTADVVVGQPWDAALPAAPAAPAGQQFAGWYTGPNGTGARVTADTVVAAGATSLYAHFTAKPQPQPDPPGPGPQPGPEPEPEETARLFASVAPALVETATVYDGRILDADGRLAGTLQVKLAKYNAKKDLAKVTASVTMLPDGKKVSYTGGEWHADSKSATLRSTRDARVLTVVLGDRGLAGTYGDCEVDGAVNLFTSKDAAAKQEGAQVLAAVQGAYTMACPGASGWSVFSVSVASRGKAKVQGVLPDGTKISHTTQLLVGEERCCVPVAYGKRGVAVAFDLWIGRDGGAVEVGGLDDAVAGPVDGTPLAGGSAFRIDADALAAYLPSPVEAEKLPDGLSVAFDGRKWVVAGGATRGEANPASLKLSLTAKTGLFKGTFKAYSLVNGRSKATTVTVNGVQVNGVGYGSALVKRAGSVPVTVSR